MFLDTIVAQTRLDLEQRKREQPLEELQRLAAAQPAPLDLYEALRTCHPERSEGSRAMDAEMLRCAQHDNSLACHAERSEASPAPLDLSEPPHTDSAIKLIAEVKRASPSKGLLAPHLDPVAIARTYEANGAAAISVLTEPHFFLGSPEYLTSIKHAVRVPVLRKDFIFDDYQVYEARAWGADALLLICAILDDRQLRRLLALAHGLHMHCLVEAHTAGEVQRAVAAGAKIIGINSRDLVTFEMHPRLARDLRPLIPPDRVVVAESGISNAADARRLARCDVQAMLVGESLVVSDDIPAQIRALLHGANASAQIKICGLRSAEHAQVAIDAGADMLGLIFYEPSHRYISPTDARALRETTSPSHSELVGVFVNREANYINDIAAQVGLDIVQLSGDEPPEFCQRIQRPVIKALRITNQADAQQVVAYQQASWRILLDTPTSCWGGSGETHDWSLAHSIAQHTPILLAGGLTPDNVAEAIRSVRPWGVDVSSGVETNKVKDVGKIQAFISNVRQKGEQSYAIAAKH